MEPLKYDENNRVILPQPDEIPDKDKMDASGAYVMMFASSYLPLPLVNLFAAFIYHMAYRKRSRFVAFHTYQSFISQIPTSLSLWGLVTWIIIDVFKHSYAPWEIFSSFHLKTAIVVIVGWNLIYTIFSIVAMVRSRKGRLFYLPLFGKHTFERYFGPNAINNGTSGPKPFINRPPQQD
jgi:uncharacterized membrane protein